MSSRKSPSFPLVRVYDHAVNGSDLRKNGSLTCEKVVCSDMPSSCGPGGTMSIDRSHTCAATHRVGPVEHLEQECRVAEEQSRHCVPGFLACDGLSVFVDHLELQAIKELDRSAKGRRIDLPLGASLFTVPSLYDRQYGA